MKDIFQRLNQFKSAESPLLLSQADNELYKKIKEDPAGFMVSIIKQQYSLYKKDMEQYLQARQVAKSIILPRRVLLYRIYDEALDTDAFIGGEWAKRKNRISN